MAAGVPVIVLHDARHTSATTGADASVPQHIMKNRLGHASRRTTDEVYTHVLDLSACKAAELMETAIFGPARTSVDNRDGSLRPPPRSAAVTPPRLGSLLRGRVVSVVRAPRWCRAPGRAALGLETGPGAITAPRPTRPPFTEPHLILEFTTTWTTS